MNEKIQKQFEEETNIDFSNSCLKTINEIRTNESYLKKYIEWLKNKLNKMER